MKRLRLFALALLAMLAPACALAAGENPNTFNDPAMSFTAPDAFKRIPIPPHDPVNFDQKAPVAAYVKNPNTPDAITIVITMDAFQGDAAAFAQNADNELRGSTDGVFIKRHDAKLSNGMPAVWEECTVGSGFAQVTTYRYLWADGVRGISVTEMSRYGLLDEKRAQADLASLSAVAYPKYRY